MVTAAELLALFEKASAAGGFAPLHPNLSRLKIFDAYYLRGPHLYHPDDAYMMVETTLMNNSQTAHREVSEPG